MPFLQDRLGDHGQSFVDDGGWLLSRSCDDAYQSLYKEVGHCQRIRRGVHVAFVELPLLHGLS